MPKPPPRVGVKNPKPKPDAAINQPPSMMKSKEIAKTPSSMMNDKEPPVVEKKESKEPKNVSKKMPKKAC